MCSWDHYLAVCSEYQSQPQLCLLNIDSALLRASHDVGFGSCSEEFDNLVGEVVTIQTALITCCYQGERERQKKETQKGRKEREDRKGEKIPDTIFNTQKKLVIFKQMFNVEMIETTKAVLSIITGEDNPLSLKLTKCGAPIPWTIVQPLSRNSDLCFNMKMLSEIRQPHSDKSV